MKNLKAMNKKAKILGRIPKDAPMDVYGNAIPFGCTYIHSPGWETSCGTGETGGLCNPWYSDLWDCWNAKGPGYKTPPLGGCWWPNQVPDHQNYPDWFKNKCKQGSIATDWVNLCFINPSTGKET